jgi:phosphoenolpyruvate carboxylase
MAKAPLPDDSAIDDLYRSLQNDGRPPLQRDIARPLARALLGVMGRSQHPDPALLAFGTTAIEALWPANEADAPARMAEIQAAIAHMPDTATQMKYAELLAKLGHMHQLAGLLLRERDLAYTKTPKTIDALLTGQFGKGNAHVYTDAAEAVAALGAPTIELTFTAHPTNTNSLSSMEAQRALGKALSALRSDAAMNGEVQTALRQYAHAPLLPEVKANGLHGFTVLNETRNMLYHLNAVYDDMPAVYAAHDRALRTQFHAYDPASLRLNVAFHSWGSSGDKDGNKNVNADSTLYSLAMHHQYILMKYADALEKIDDPALLPWREKIRAACASLTDITTSMHDALNTQPYLDERTHNARRTQLRDTLKAIDMPAFERALEDSYHHAIGEHPDATLLLLRRVRMFGRSFGTIEFRETAEEFTRIIAHLIPGYEKADEATRQRLLNDTLGNPQALKGFSAALHQLAAHGAEKPYSATDVAPIAYHTLKRLELARDFPEAIQNHVLAECQDASNLLELLLLQHATGKDGARATLGIVPLFEDREPLENAPALLKNLLNNPHYLAHLEAVAAKKHQPPAQQIQLAHSDSTRRNGLPAARALIYETHAQVRKTMDEVNKARPEHPIALQFYEGGSLTDSYRGGTRAISAAVNEFGIHDFAKMTVQGGDMLNYFNLPHSTYRVMLRNISNGTARLKTPSGTARLQEDKIIAALIACSDDYKMLFEGKGALRGQLNSFFESIDFAAESAAGNASSRAAKRDDAGTGVDVTSVRTISFSEGCQHAGLNPSWIGSLTLAQHMAEQGIMSDPKTLHALYNGASPLFRDVVDRMLFGLVRTDMDYLRERSNNHPLITRLEDEYSKAFTLCMEAYTGKPLAELTGGKELTPAEQHQLLVDTVYAHTKDVFDDQQRFTDILRGMKAQCAHDHSPATAALRMALHNGMDTVVHGRLPLIDDPTYATLYCDARGIERPHGPTLDGAYRSAA